MREDNFTSTVDGAAAFERHRAMSAGEFDDRPDPSDYADLERLPLCARPTCENEVEFGGTYCLDCELEFDAMSEAPDESTESGR